ncbi:MAG: type II secretion system protein [Patescibacteria group bacterium]
MKHGFTHTPECSLRKRGDKRMPHARNNLSQYHGRRHLVYGFTLLEVLLSVAILSLLAGIGAPIFQSFQTRNALDITATEIAQNIRRAQALSRASEGDTTWGAFIQNGQVTLFKGASFATRDTDYDETIDLSSSITPSGVSEIVFSKLTGLPSATGTITLTSNTNETRNIIINAQGVPSY